jgi:uncharacterized membrane protein YfcA
VPAGASAVTTEQEIVVALLSAVSAFIAGLLGAGGDILYVPLLLYGLPALTGEGLTVHAVAALSLVGSLASTGSGGLQHWRAGKVDSEALWPAWIVLAAGAVAGGLLSSVISARALLLAFAIVTTAAAGLLFVGAGEDAQAPRRGRDPLAAALLCGGALLCGAVGVGGGFLIITILLHRMRLPMHLARGTGLMLTFFTAAPALAGKAVTGQVPWAPVPLILLTGFVGAVAGSHASALVPSRILRWALASLVVVLSVRVWFNVLSGEAA